jgi:protocatechuate 3,4-dioxygenase beta subunit
MWHRSLLAFGTVLAACILLALFLSGAPVESQEPPTLQPPPAEVYFLRLQPLSGDSRDTLQSAYDRLRPALIELRAKRQILSFEFLLERESARIVAPPGDAVFLATLPQVAAVEPLHPRPPISSRPAPRQRITGILQPYVISGTVQNYDGTPLDGVYVSTAWDDPADAWDFTDASGSYSLTVGVAGTYHVEASKWELPSPPEQTVTVPPNQRLDFTFPQPYTIRGTVTDHTGAPVEDAQVSTAWDDPVFASESTDSSGAYTLTVRAGAYHIGAYKTGYPDPDEQVVTLPPDATGIDFSFPPTYTISGSVYDQDGIPVPGADVYGGLESSITAADGSFTITNGPGEHYVSASKDGYYSPHSVLVPLPPDASGVDLVLLVEDGRVEGQIVDDQGTPVADALVRADNAVCGDWGDGGTTTAADGTYSLTVPSGIYHVTASKIGHVPAGPQEVVVPSGAPSANANLVLDRAQNVIRGTVWDSTDQPLEDAMVSASTCGLQYAVSTDASGAYTLPVGVGTYTVQATKTDYASGAPQLVSVPPNASNVDFHLAALTLYTVTGRVTDPGGQPIEDARVSTGPDDVYYDVDYTESDGTYMLRVLAGTYHVDALKNGYSRPDEQVVSVPPSRSGVDFVMMPSHLTIQGTVRDTGGSPLATAYVFNRLPGDRVSVGTRVYFDGSYIRSVITGTHKVDAWATCYVDAVEQEVTVPPSQSGIDFSLAPRDQLISGIVSDTNGVALCGVDVEAEPVGDGASDSDETERNGLFALQVPAGTYTVQASKAGYGVAPAATVTVPPHARATNFALPAPDNMVQGAVRDKQGVAVPGATVVASGAGGNLSTSTGSAGTYTIMLIDGSWTISASKAGYTAFTGSQSVSVPPDQTGIDFLLIPNEQVRRTYLPVILR